MTDTKDDVEISSDPINAVNEALRQYVKDQFSPLRREFLRQSIGIINPASPVCISNTATVEEALAQLSEPGVDCLLVTDLHGKLRGLFTLKDYVGLAASGGVITGSSSLEETGFKEPISIAMEASMAFVLNIMVNGDERYLPILDTTGTPVGIISSDSLLDYLVKTSIDNLLTQTSITS